MIQPIDSMIFPVYTSTIILNICCVTAWTACFYENKKSCRYDFKKMKELPPGLVLIKTKIQGNSSTVKFNKNIISLLLAGLVLPELILDCVLCAIVMSSRSHL